MENVIDKYNIGKVQLIIIRDYITIGKYLEEKKKVDFNHVNTNLLWDNGRQCIKKAAIFAFHFKGAMYNITLSGEGIIIDKKYEVGSNCKEKEIFVYPLLNEYKYAFMEHDEIGSTFYNKIYSKGEKVDFDFMQEVYDDIDSILNDLKHIAELKEFVNINAIRTTIFNDINNNAKLSLNYQ